MKPSIIDQIRRWKIFLPIKLCKRYIHTQLIRHVFEKYWYWRLVHEFQYLKENYIRNKIESFQPILAFTLITYIKKDESILYFSETAESVLSQYYPHWNWYIFCEQKFSQQIISLIPEHDPKKITIIEIADTSEINRYLYNAEGDYIGFLESNDELAPFALLEIVRKVNEKPSIDFLFSDEDHINKKNRRYDPWFKPEYNLYNLRSCNYLIHFLVIRRSFGNEIHWFGTSKSGLSIMSYDLILRLAEKTGNISHIPSVLYHSRKTRSIGPVTEKEYVTEPEYLLALRNHLSRMNIKADVMPNNYPESFHVRYLAESSPLISIIIPNKDQKEVLQRCIESILNKTTYLNYEIIIVENNSETSETFEYYRILSSDPKFKGRVITWRKPFNYSAINNWAIKNSNGEFVILLNNDTEIITPNWIEEMLGIAQQPDAGAVGVKLLFPDGSLQHGGAGFDRFIPNSVYHIAQKSNRENSGYYGIFRKINAFSVVTAACMMFNREKFITARGFDETFDLDLNDVDLCLQFLRKGWINIFTPYVELFHHESLSRRYDILLSQKINGNNKYSYFSQKWKDFIIREDPFLSSYLRFDQYRHDMYQ